MKTMFSLYRDVLKHFYRAGGPMSREQYWSYMAVQAIINSLVVMVLGILMFIEFVQSAKTGFVSLDQGSLLVTQISVGVVCLYIAYLVLCFVPTLIASLKRFRGAGHSGWEFLLLFVVGAACAGYSIFLLFSDGTVKVMDNAILELFLSGLIANWIGLVFFVILALPDKQAAD